LLVLGGKVTVNQFTDASVLSSNDIVLNGHVNLFLLIRANCYFLIGPQFVLYRGSAAAALQHSTQNTIKEWLLTIHFGLLTVMTFDPSNVPELGFFHPMKTFHAQVADGLGAIQARHRQSMVMSIRTRGQQP
jgi:hypothetical protein